MEKKIYNAKIELKENSDETGKFEAVFSRFQDVDKHGDVTNPGAFHDGQEIRIAAWGHNWGDLPVGKGHIRQDQEKAWVDGKFFLDTVVGREHYLTVKNLGELQQWSYGFEVLKSSEGEYEGKKVRFLEDLDVFEVSPVMIGAGNDTQTLAIKSEGEKPEPEVEQEVKTESETEEVGNESGVDPADMKLLIEIIALEAKNE